MIWLSVLLILALLALSACFAAIETAVTAASPGRIHKLKSAGNKKAIAASSFLKMKEKVISTLLVGNSFINTIVATMATSIFIGIYGEETGTLISSGVMAFMIIVFAEVIPKAIAVAKAEKILLRSVPLVKISLMILTPVNFGLNLILRAFCFVFRIKLTQEVSAAEEVRGVIEHHHKEGNVLQTDRDMLASVLDMRSMDVSEIMVHRSHILSIDASLPMEEIISRALNMAHTRIPLWKDSKENIIGILHIKDLLKAIHKNSVSGLYPKSAGDLSKLKLKDFTTDPWFIPDNALVIHQLNAFREKRSHIALVIDEYGDLQGLVSLEDILEEIVGQIEDEHDITQSRIIKKSGRVIIDGSESVRDINRELGWNLPDENASTLAGLIIHEAQKLPEQGEVFEMFGMKITVRKRLSNRIKTLVLEPIKVLEDDEGDDL